ncbi:MAG: ABC transporter permease [Victivallales bacterium]|nr:ABC transporter permease [Victivallales bacterium]
MKSFLAIFKQTIRSAMRSKVFHVLFVLILLCVIGLPLTIKGDNTASGLVQVSLTYSLNLVIALISASTLWLGCSQLATEIEGYQIHLVTTKPCRRWVVWAGKTVGVFLMHAVLLVISMFIIYALTLYRLGAAQRSGLFTEQDMEKLRQETLVGRRSFRPTPVALYDDIQREYEKRVKNGTVNPEDNPKVVKKMIQAELVQEIMKNVSIEPGKNHSWAYENVRLGKNDPVLYLRFRLYTGDITDTDQKQIPVDWGFQVFKDENGQALTSASAENAVVWYSTMQGRLEVVDGKQMVVPQPFMMPGGTWQELTTMERGETEFTTLDIPILSSMVVNDDARNRVVLHFHNFGDLYLPDAASVPSDDESKLAYNKLKENYTAIFQVADGPVLLSKVTGFFSNFVRTMLMAIIQLAFMAGLGCTVGAIFSTPVAVFVAISYLVIGLSATAAVEAPLKNPDGSYMYKNLAERVLHYVAQGVQWCVVTLDELDCTSDLANGRLVETGDIIWTFIRVLILRTGILAGVGIFILNRRELGLVVRKA